MNRKLVFALVILVVAMAVWTIVVFTVRQLLIATVHPIMGPAWMLMVITVMFLFVVQKTDNKVSKAFSRWVWQGTLKE